MTDQSRLTWALVLSVLLHGLLLSLLPLMRRARLEIPTPPLVDVDLVQLPKAVAPKAAPGPAVPAPAAPAVPVPPPPVPKQQIVSPPDEGEEKAPPNPRLLSDRDNTVKEEMVHRGEPARGNPEAQRPPAPEKATAPERPQPARKAAPERSGSNTKAAALPKLDQLLPQPGDLVSSGMAAEASEPAAAAPVPQQQAANQRTDLLRHGDPWNGSSLRGGTRDYLPAVREGDVTMLNTKAEQFAPFVRRVAIRVFENVVISLRRSYADGKASEEYATVEAVMDKQGNLVTINTKDRSVSAALATDRNLQTAVRQGFFDRNPPPGAESNDGNIHFVFDTRVVLVVSPNGHRMPAWALLGAGLL